MLVERYPLVWVAATAGAGKTTAVVQAARSIERPVAWLTLDATDAAPGRLVTYLEAALARCAPQVDGVGTGALARRIAARRGRGPARRGGRDEPGAAGHRRARASGRRAGGAGGTRRPPPLRAADACGSCSSAAASWPSTWATPRRWAAWPPSARPTWPSRPRRRRGRWPTWAAARSTRSRAVAATGGWVAGVLFEAWRSEDHVAGHRRRGRPALRLPVVADPRAARRRRPRVPGGHVAAGGGDADRAPRRSASPPPAIACSRCAPRTCR